MVLPRSKKIESGEIGICNGTGLSRPANTGDIDADVVWANLGNNSTSYAVLCHAEHAN